MENTMEMMKGLLVKEEVEMTLEEVAEQYKITKSPTLLAAAFYNMYGLTNQVANKFWGVDKAEISSKSLITIDKALLQYEPGKAKFTTYYSVVLNNALRTHTQYLNTNARKTIHTAISQTELQESGFDIVYKGNDTYYNEIIANVQLDSNHLEYCKLLNAGYTNAEIVGKLKVSKMTLSNWRKVIQEKLCEQGLQFV